MCNHDHQIKPLHIGPQFHDVRAASEKQKAPIGTRRQAHRSHAPRQVSVAGRLLDHQIKQLRARNQSRLPGRYPDEALVGGPMKLLEQMRDKIAKGVGLEAYNDKLKSLEQKFGLERLKQALKDLEEKTTDKLPGVTQLDEMLKKKLDLEPAKTNSGIDFCC